MTALDGADSRPRSQGRGAFTLLGEKNAVAPAVEKEEEKRYVLQYLERSAGIVAGRLTRYRGATEPDCQ